MLTLLYNNKNFDDLIQFFNDNINFIIEEYNTAEKITEFDFFIIILFLKETEFSPDISR